MLMRAHIWLSGDEILMKCTSSEVKQQLQISVVLTLNLGLKHDSQELRMHGIGLVGSKLNIYIKMLVVEVVSSGRALAIHATVVSRNNL